MSERLRKALEWIAAQDEREGTRVSDVTLVAKNALTPALPDGEEFEAERKRNIASLGSPLELLGLRSSRDGEGAWCGWHPKHGWALQTCGHNQQHAASLLMRTGIAGNHGWSVQPLYVPPPPASGDVRALTAEQVLEWLKSRPGISWEITVRDVEKAIRALAPSGEK